MRRILGIVISSISLFGIATTTISLIFKVEDSEKIVLSLDTMISLLVLIGLLCVGISIVASCAGSERGMDAGNTARNPFSSRFLRIMSFLAAAALIFGFFYFVWPRLPEISISLPDLDVWERVWDRFWNRFWDEGVKPLLPGPPPGKWHSNGGRIPLPETPLLSRAAPGLGRIPRPGEMPRLPVPVEPEEDLHGVRLLVTLSLPFGRALFRNGSFVITYTCGLTCLVLIWALAWVAALLSGLFSFERFRLGALAVMSVPALLVYPILWGEYGVSALLFLFFDHLIFPAPVVCVLAAFFNSALNLFVSLRLYRLRIRLLAARSEQAAEAGAASDPKEEKATRP